MKWYESTHLHSTTHHRRAGADPGEFAFVVGFCLTTLPDSPSLSTRRTCHCHCPFAWLRRPDRAQCDQRLQRSGLGRAQTRFDSPPPAADPAPRRQAACVESSVASQSPRLRLPDQSVDGASGYQDRLPARTLCPVNLWSQSASRPQTLRRALETGQTLDYQPRSGVPSKKNARDRLIAYCSPRPDWAIGYLDEVWWSRFALPQAHAWQDEEDPLRLIEKPRQKDDPDPKALACYGVLWHRDDPSIPLREQMWLRFVDGRPVSAITTQFLDWCCERLLLHGKRNWLLSLSITPPGMSPSWRAPSFVSTITRSSSRAKVCASCLSSCPQKAPGSTPLNRNGFMANAILSHMIACFRLGNWLSGSATILAARISTIYLFPKRYRNYALGDAYV